MGISSSHPESIAIRLIADKPVRKTPYQVKGVFMKQFPGEKIVPFLDGKLRNKYLYPRVQVKILNEKIEEQFATEDSYELNLTIQSMIAKH